MQFAGNSTSQDLVSETRSLCDADSTSYAIADVTRRINIGYEFLIGKILSADGYWQWDDTNFSNLPKGTGLLVNNQETYSFSAEYLNIQMVEILNNASPAKYIKIDPIESIDLGGMSPEEYFGITSGGNPQTGMPRYYDKIGDTIILYPAPNSSFVTLTAGIRIWFQRTADLFTTTDTTQEPGLPSPYHYLLAVYAAIPFCASFKKDRVAWLERKWQEGIEDMLSFFGKRSKDEHDRLTVESVSFR